jgi:beta-glucosidase
VKHVKSSIGAGALAALLLVGAALAAPPARPWMDPKLSPDRRAELVLQRMSLDEQISLLHGHMPMFMKPVPAGVVASAGYFPGLPKLGIPELKESDASLGVANARRGDKDDATPLPSGLAMASSFSPEIAFEGGAMIGKQARQKGFNILLAGGGNLVRDPRNGRNFEYLSEDPLLSGVLEGAAIRGIQSNHIVSTAKHYVLNDQETGRSILSARIAEAPLRESDLLAFEIGIEQGDPGSVMCAYNKINGVWACEHPGMLNDALKRDWGWKGWVMSDWGAVHSLDAAVAGLDQESGQELDRQVFFDQPLKDAVKSGRIPAARVHDMAHRVLRSLFAKGVIDHPLAPGGLDTAADAAVAGKAAEQGLVLLKNAGVLPLAAHAGKIAVIGGHADVGVLSGGGSSQVVPLGSIHFPAAKGAPAWTGGVVYHPSSPLKAIAARAGAGQAVWADGADPAAAAAAARSADIAVVFAGQWSTEAMDVPLELPDGQDALIEAVAAANPHTIVVLETGGPVLMPWLGKVAAVVEAWYPGARGGEAIARLLYGEIPAAGRLPVSFPAGEDELPRPRLPGLGLEGPETFDVHQQDPKPFDVDYSEGSDVGYRWYAKTGKTPLFPFGYGLSYTSFRYGDFKASGGQTVTVSFTVTNTGSRAGIDTPQVYLTRSPSRAQQRLIGFSRVELKPGESRRVTLTADRRLLADWDEKAHGWKISGGAYSLFVGSSAAEPAQTATAQVSAATLKP